MACKICKPKLTSGFCAKKYSAIRWLYHKSKGKNGKVITKVESRVQNLQVAFKMWNSFTKRESRMTIEQKVIQGGDLLSISAINVHFLQKWLNRQKNLIWFYKRGHRCGWNDRRLHSRWDGKRQFILNRYLSDCPYIRLVLFNEKDIYIVLNEHNIDIFLLIFFLLLRSRYGLIWLVC